MVVAGGDRVYASRHGSPLVVGIGDGASYLASDVPAFLDRTDEVVYLDDGDVVELGPGTVTITDLEGRPVDRPTETVDWTPEEAEKGRFEHFMLKEIDEQPLAIRRAIEGRLGEEGVSLDPFPSGSLADVSRVHLVACGTSYHAALYATVLLSDRGIPATATLASEFVAMPPPDEGALVVGVTQSGETADTLGALRAARSRGLDTLAVTNTVGSTAARECDDALFIRAGPEIGVAATKTFSSQVATLCCLAERIAEDRPGATPRPESAGALGRLPDAVETVVDGEAARTVAGRYQGSDAHFFIGRATAYPVALEGALKLKEISYEHAEGFAAGELKHGPLALVTEDTPVFAVADGRHGEKLLSNVQEVQARGAPVVAVGPADAPAAEAADALLPVPGGLGRLGGVAANVALQLVSYHVASLLNRPIDKPRNLAKSVTVE